MSFVIRMKIQVCIYVQVFIYEKKFKKTTCLFEKV